MLSFTRTTTRFGVIGTTNRMPCLSLYSTANRNHGFYKDLNDAQLAAVTSPLESITRVVAGPGAGKTKALTCRIAHLLYSSPQKVLAVTFTKKAANEMKERLETLIQSEAGNTQVVANHDNVIYEHDQQGFELLNRVTLGTFHSICAKILRWNGKDLAALPSVVQYATTNVNLNGNFNIMDQTDQLRVVRDILKHQLKIDLKQEQTKAQAILTTMSSFQKTGSLPPKEEIDKSKLLRIASRVYPRYRQELYGSNALDFDDLLFLTHELLLVNPTLTTRLQQYTWQHVLVDEFQDTSKLQLDLIELMTNTSLFIVGDADQSIYSWRGAHVTGMTSDFESKFPSVHTVYLMENYRSTTNIVRAAQKVISHNENNTTEKDEKKNAAITNNLELKRHDMKPMRGHGPKPRVKSCAHGKAEAAYVVKTILNMQQEMTPQTSVAILYRTNAQSLALEEECVKHNLPYLVRGSAGTFYNRMEIKDCLCFLKWLSNGHDVSSMMRCFKVPPKGIGTKAMEEFQNYCQAVQQECHVDKPTLLELLIATTDHKAAFNTETIPQDYISTRALNRFKAFSRQVATIRDLAYTESISDLLACIIDIMELKAHWNSVSKSQSEFADRWNNVQELRQAAKRHETKNKKSSSIVEALGGKLQPQAVENNGAMSDMLSKNSDSSSDAALGQQQTVSAMSLDNNEAMSSPLSNFLDDIALVTDMASDNDNDEDVENKRAKVNLMTIHASKGMEFDIVFIVGNEDGTFPTNRAIQEGPGSVQLDEERRLCYVAMTRAKDQLIMTWRREVSFYQNEFLRTVDRERSRFLDALLGTKAENAKNDNVAVRKKRKTSRQVESTGTRRFSSVANGSKPQRNGSTFSAPRVRATLGQTRPQKALAQTRKQTDNTVASNFANPSKPQSRTRPKQNRNVKTRAKQQETIMDSTWFFPVGSSVVHMQHGPGTVLPPNSSNDNGEMMVRVLLQNGDTINVPAMGRDLFPN